MSNETAPDSDPELEEKLKHAEALLWREVEGADPETGETVKMRGATDLYRDYLDRQQAYIDASLAYSAECQEAMKTPQGRGTWPLVAGTKQLPVKQAYDKWRAAGADKIEEAIRIIDKAWRPEPG